MFTSLVPEAPLPIKFRCAVADVEVISIVTARVKDLSRGKVPKTWLSSSLILTVLFGVKSR